MSLSGASPPPMEGQISLREKHTGVTAPSAMETSDGHVTDARGSKEGSGDPLDRDGGSFSDAEEEVGDNTVSMLNEGAELMLNRAVKATLEAIVADKPHNVAGPIAAIVEDMYAEGMRRAADRAKEALATRAKIIHKREQARIRQQRRRLKAAAAAAAEGGAAAAPSA